jgi:amino acid transporter
MIVGAGLWFVMKGAVPAAQPGSSVNSAIPMAMVFVLLTYGGWNEAAYLSAEVSGDRRNIARALMWGIGVVTGIYLLVNLAFLLGLGLDGMRGSSAIAADLLARVTGNAGATIISVIIVIAALSTANGTIFTGARTNYALGRDFPLFRALGQWHDRRDTPANALLVQGLIALALVLFGALTREGIQTMVDYTSPIFWFFFFLVGVSIFVLRRRDAGIERPFRVPLYPLTPLLFCAVCAYMFYASVAYAKIGSLTGLAVLAVGVPVMLVARARRDDPTEPRGFEPIVNPPAEAMES